MRWTWVLAVLLTACTLPGGASRSAPDLITPSEARQVVTSYWTQNEKANVASDPRLLEPIESGPALIFDQVLATRSARVNRHLAEARPLRKLTVYVPHQSRYPAEFAARIDTVNADPNGHVTTEPFSFLNLFEMDSAGQPWKSTFFVGLAPDDMVTIAIRDDGYVTQAPIAGGAQAVPPGQIGQLVADYLNTATAGMGVDDSKLDGAPRIEAVARNQKLSIEAARRAGFTLTATAAPGPGGSHPYLSAQGHAVVFFAVSTVEVVTAARDGACLIQDQRLRLPPEVPPGSYGRVENKLLAMVIASDPPAGRGKAKVLDMVTVDYDFKVEAAPGKCIETGPPPATV